MVSSAYKPLLFGFYGAVGCVLGALLGEILLRYTHRDALPPPPDKPDAVCLLVDTSGSMEGSRIEEARRAAKAFVLRQREQRIAVARFDTASAVVAPFGTGPGEIAVAIDQFAARGGTAMHAGLEAAAASFGQFSPDTYDRYIVLFTDGQPDSPFEALSVATRLRRQGFRLIAIATGGANASYLARLTGDTRLVLWAGDGKFDDAFAAAAELIKSGSLIDSSSATELLPSLLRIAGWTTLLSVGLALLLVVGQNHYLRRRLITLGQLAGVTVMAACAGALAGAGGQLLFAGARRPEALDVIGVAVAGAVVGAICAFRADAGSGRLLLCTLAGLLIAGGGTVAGLWYYRDVMLIPWYLVCGAFALASGIATSLVATAIGKKDSGFGGGVVLGLLMLGLFYFAPAYFLSLQSATAVLGRGVGWAVLGGALGVGMALFVPNLPRGKALFGGVVGGTAGAGAFLLAERYGGEMSGRVAGAAAIGFFIGLMIALAEVAFRVMWLEVVYGPREKRQVNLGDRPVTVGSSSESTIYVAGIAPVAARFVQENGSLIGIDVSTGRRVALKPGDQKTFGNLAVVVRGSTTTRSAEASPTS